MAHTLCPTVEPGSRVRVAYFGTPPYAAPALRQLYSDPIYEVALVVTQPDRPAGRHHKLAPPAVKIVAEELGLQVYQPESLRSDQARAPLHAVDADVFVVAAYGRIFGASTLVIPRRGCVNLHASLLPRYRGASPIAAAILRGDAETGASLMVMDRGIDTGPVLATAVVQIEPGDTAASLGERLGQAGARLVVERLEPFVRGALTPVDQPLDGASLTRPLTKADGLINWRLSAEEIERRVRAMWPWPRAWTISDDTTIQIHVARVETRSEIGQAGRVKSRDGYPVVACGAGSLRLLTIQVAGGKPISGTAWLAGRRGALPRFDLGIAASTTDPLVTPVGN